VGYVACLAASPPASRVSHVCGCVYGVRHTRSEPRMCLEFREDRRARSARAHVHAHVPARSRDAASRRACSTLTIKRAHCPPPPRAAREPGDLSMWTPPLSHRSPAGSAYRIVVTPARPSSFIALSLRHAPTPTHPHATSVSLRSPPPNRPKVTRSATRTHSPQPPRPRPNPHSSRVPPCRRPRLQWRRRRGRHWRFARGASHAIQTRPPVTRPANQLRVSPSRRVMLGRAHMTHDEPPAAAASPTRSAANAFCMRF